MDVAKWRKTIENQREQKDEFFILHPQSPIPLESRSHFGGLSYYPPDVNYRFELELQEHPNKKVVKIEDTGGNIRDLIRWGELHFTIGGEECTLQAYQSEPGETRFFIPFRDGTSNKETYGAGRYLDLEPDSHMTSAGKWILDFNQAYNPWCAYSEDYVCPFVPPENWLKVPIRVGEKNYHLEASS